MNSTAPPDPPGSSETRGLIRRRRGLPATVAGGTARSAPRSAPTASAGLRLTGVERLDHRPTERHPEDARAQKRPCRRRGGAQRLPRDSGPALGLRPGRMRGRSYSGEPPGRHSGRAGGTLRSWRKVSAIIAGRPHPFTGKEPHVKSTSRGRVDRGWEYCCTAPVQVDNSRELRSPTALIALLGRFWTHRPGS